MSIEVLQRANFYMEQGYSREQALVSAWVAIEEEKINEFVNNTLGEE